MPVQIKRAYDEPARSDGYRVLVDRLWPRGRSRAQLHLDAWLKELAPSTELREWFGHDPARWTEFKRRYRLELRRQASRPLIEQLAARARRQRVTLVYGARDSERNDAVVLRSEIERGNRPVT
jgi:uncharacterized protein YeaO (DUF488 family)